MKRILCAELALAGAVVMPTAACGIDIPGAIGFGDDLGKQIKIDTSAEGQPLDAVSIGKIGNVAVHVDFSQGQTIRERAVRESMELSIRNAASNLEDESRVHKLTVGFKQTLPVSQTSRYYDKFGIFDNLTCKTVLTRVTGIAYSGSDKDASTVSGLDAAYTGTCTAEVKGDQALYSNEKKLLHETPVKANLSCRTTTVEHFSLSKLISADNSTIKLPSQGEFINSAEPACDKPVWQPIE